VVLKNEDNMLPLGAAGGRLRQHFPQRRQGRAGPDAVDPATCPRASCSTRTCFSR
jgi:hypothetical protein